MVSIEAEIHQELRWALDGQTFVDLDVRKVPKLHAWLTAEIADKRVPRNAQSTALVIQAAALRRPSDVTNSAGKRPLLGAKHLLALGEYDLRTPMRRVEDCNRSLEFFWAEGGKRRPGHPVDLGGLRKRIASDAAGYGIDRKNLSPNNPRGHLDAIVAALWAQIQLLARDPNLRGQLQNVQRISDARLRSYDAYKDGRSPHPEHGTTPAGARDEFRPHRRRRLAVIVATLTGVAFSITAVLVLPQTTPNPTAPNPTRLPTETIVERPFVSADADHADLDMTSQTRTFECSKSSLVSIRRDAHLCSSGDFYPVYDPCFEVSADVVSCASRPGRDGDVLAVREYHDAFWDQEREDHLVSTDAPLDSYYPWAITLKNPPADGASSFCTVRFEESGSPTNVSYSCEKVTIRMIPNLMDFFSGSAPQALEMTLPIAGFEAFDLDRKGETWTIRVAEKGSSEYKEIDVLKAYF